MRAVHSGEALDRAAQLLRRQLPPGPAVLLATSLEGVAVAAVCAAGRPEFATRWERLNLVVPVAVAPSERVVVVEPVDGGSGWQRTIARQYPDALFLFAAPDEMSLAA